MIQQVQNQPHSDTTTLRRATTPAPTIWGLSAKQLHEAFWRARGVQCIWRGERVDIQRAAEVFLLIEPNQLAVFDIADLSERLVWHNAAVTRLRLVDQDDAPYSEHVVTDSSGVVRSIERRYRARVNGSHRVILTPSERLARLWMEAPSRRQGWDRLRRAVPWSRVDHWRCSGRVFEDGEARQENEFLDELVERWQFPGQSIAGIREIEPGVWQLATQPMPEESVRIGPLWIGCQPAQIEQRCMVGPQWIADENRTRARDAAAAVMIRDIIDVEFAERPVNTQSTAGNVTYAISKRVFDIVMSIVALLCLWPVMLVIGALIWLEDGPPILFAHHRQGRNGRPFRCWKFRTMLRNAEAMAEDLDDYNVCDGPQVYIRNDPRVTRVGKMLRRLHLDELPQFYNVLRGQMSIVGPRPSPDRENQFCPAWRDMRLSVRPGITGLWQLNRTRAQGQDFQEWIKYDIDYVRNASFWLDMAIVFRTFASVVSGRN